MTREQLATRLAQTEAELAMVADREKALITKAAQQDREAQQLRESNARVRDSERTLRTVSDAERAVVDMETGLRGYALTLDVSFLAPYRSGSRAAQVQTAALERVTVDEPAEHVAAVRAREQVSDYITEYAQPSLTFHVQTDARCTSSP